MIIASVICGVADLAISAYSGTFGIERAINAGEAMAMPPIVEIAVAAYPGRLNIALSVKIIMGNKISDKHASSTPPTPDFTASIKFSPAPKLKPKKNKVMPEAGASIFCMLLSILPTIIPSANGIIVPKTTIMLKWPPAKSININGVVGTAIIFMMPTAALSILSPKLFIKPM